MSPLNLCSIFWIYNIVFGTSVAKQAKIHPVEKYGEASCEGDRVIFVSRAQYFGGKGQESVFTVVSRLCNMRQRCYIPIDRNILGLPTAEVTTNASESSGAVATTSNDAFTRELVVQYDCVHKQQVLSICDDIQGINITGATILFVNMDNIFCEHVKYWKATLNWTDEQNISIGISNFEKSSENCTNSLVRINNDENQKLRLCYNDRASPVMISRALVKCMSIAIHLVSSPEEVGTALRFSSTRKDTTVTVRSGRLSKNLNSPGLSGGSTHTAGNDNSTPLTFTNTSSYTRTAENPTSCNPVKCNQKLSRVWLYTSAILIAVLLVIVILNLVLCKSGRLHLVHYKSRDPQLNSPIYYDNHSHVVLPSSAYQNDVPDRSFASIQRRATTHSQFSEELMYSDPRPTHSLSRQHRSHSIPSPKAPACSVAGNLPPIKSEGTSTGRRRHSEATHTNQRIRQILNGQNCQTGPASIYMLASDPYQKQLIQNKQGSVSVESNVCPQDQIYANVPETACPCPMRKNSLYTKVNKSRNNNPEPQAKTSPAGNKNDAASLHYDYAVVDKSQESSSRNSGLGYIRNGTGTSDESDFMQPVYDSVN